MHAFGTAALALAVAYFTTSATAAGGGYYSCAAGQLTACCVEYAGGVVTGLGEGTDCK